MKSQERKLDRKFLSFLYKDRVNDIDKVFETFITNAPEEITQICMLINQKSFSKATKKINQLIPALNSVGLPSLSIKLQIVEVHINFHKINNALICLQEFDNELNQFMPILLNEYSRLKAYNNFIKIQPTRALSTQVQ